MLLPLSHRRSALRASGFTLIELLTVVAIIGVLAAILFPAIGRAKDAARSSVCASNLRQLSAACLLYASDNKGRLVPIDDGAPTAGSTSPGDATTGNTWRIKIEPYIGSRRDGNSILICPADSITSYPASSATGQWPTSYGLNPATQLLTGGTLLQYGPGNQSQMLSAINQPSRFIMISDIGRNQGAGAGGDPATWTEDRTATSPSYGYARFPWGGAFNLEWGVWGRHGGGRKANVAFYDGHVATVDLVTDLQNHPNGDPACLFDNH